MTETQAMIGYGSKFAISTDGGATFTYLAEVSEITPPSDTIDTVEATHMQSPNSDREYIPGLNDPGVASFAMNFIPGSSADALVQTVKAARAKVKCQVTFPNGVTWAFTGALTKYEPAVPLDGKMTATVSFKASSSVITGAESSPVNSVLPAISGVQQVGHLLTALDGIWSGAPTFTYQWKRDGSAISGATSKTYTAVSGDATHALTVTVTGTNSAGNAAATSGATGAVAS